MRVIGKTASIAIHSQPPAAKVVSTNPPRTDQRMFASYDTDMAKTKVLREWSLEKSTQFYSKAVELMPGGVSSPVRSFKSVGLTPVFVQSGQGAYLKDADGNRYIDYVMSYGPLILGHAHPAVRVAVAKQLSRGSSFGCCSPLEIELAETITRAVPSIEMVRFVNSGTEAAMSAIRLARGVTGREVIIKMAGGYHGHVDAMLVSAGSGATTHGVPSSPGILQSVAQSTVVVEFNDIAALKGAFEAHGGRVAAVMMEPIMGNIGVVLPRQDYLRQVRDLCRANGALLIFDEVMTGFRVSFSGAQGLFGVMPDITCLGKVIGGGLPTGAYGGSKALMNHISPAGPIYQAGTLSGNPLAMAAGLATLQYLNPDDPYAPLALLGRRLEEGLAAAAENAGVPIRTARSGSMFTPFFVPRGGDSGTPITHYSDALKCDTRAYAVFFKSMLEQGVMLPPSQFEAWFISAAHTMDDIEATISKAKTAFERCAAEAA